MQEKQNIKGFIILSIITIPLVIAQIFLVGFYFSILPGSSSNSNQKTFSMMAMVLTVIFIIIAVLILVFLILAIVLNNKGKLKKQLFIVPIIIGFYSFAGIPYAIFSIITLTKVKAAPKPQIETSEEFKQELESVHKENEIEPQDVDADENNKETNVSYYFSGEVEKRTNMPTFVIMSVIYLVIFILGLISLFGVNVLWDVKELNMVSGGWFVAFSMSFGIYLFMLSPFNFSKKINKIGTICSIILMLLVDILPIVLIIINKDALNVLHVSLFKLFTDKVIIIITMIASEVGITVGYFLTKFNFNPTKLKMKEATKQQQRSVVAKIIRFIGYLILGLINSFYVLMKLKNKSLNIYVVFILALLTFLCPILAEIMVMWIILLVFSGLVLIWAKGVTNYSEIKVRSSDGNEVELYQNTIGEYWYDDSGNKWIKKGDKFYKLD